MSPSARAPLPISQAFTPAQSQEPPHLQALIDSLSMHPHIEGGYFTETDRAPDSVPSPFPYSKSSTEHLAPQRPGFNPDLRSRSTSIFYLLTPKSPQGGFHRNKGRTVHTLHRGRGQYVVIHANEEGGRTGRRRIETFVVGQDIEKGERLQWVVEGGKYKASFLLPDVEDGSSSGGLLISETVVPGFEYCDHDFLTDCGLKELVNGWEFEQLKFLLRPGN